MTQKPCPTESELLAFVDAELSPEQLKRVEQHLEGCSRCAGEVVTLTRLTEDIAVPLVPAASLDVAEHVRGVMRRLDEPVTRRPKVAVWGAAALSALAAAAALLLFFGGAQQQPRGELAARGAPGEHTLSRDVGVQLYGQAPELRPLSAGGQVRVGEPLTAGLRNTGTEPAHLLLFAVDANGVVHWIAPQYTVSGSNPAAVSLAPAPEERLLPTSAVFDDLAPGPLRVVALLSARPSNVSEVEALTPAQLSSESLTKRFPRAEVRELVLQVIR